MLSFNDIEELFRPVTEVHFNEDDDLSLQDIYEEIFSMEKEQMERLKEDIVQKYQASTETFPEREGEDRDYPVSYTHLDVYKRQCQYFHRQYFNSQIDFIANIKCHMFDKQIIRDRKVFSKLHLNGHSFFYKIRLIICI